MIAAETIASRLKLAICAPLEVSAVPMGYHIATGFPLPDGDVLSFYLIEDTNGIFHMEDDGLTLPDAIGRGFDFASASRESLLRTILGQEGARVDDDFVIRTEPFTGDHLGKASVSFISALIRTRDLFVMSRENVAISFADDVRSAILPLLPANIVVDADQSSEGGDADITLRDSKTGLKKARIFAANSDVRLMDALVEHLGAVEDDSPVIAVVDRRRARVSDRRFNSATNRGLPMAVVDGVGSDWMSRVIDLSTGSRKVH